MLIEKATDKACWSQIKNNADYAMLLESVLTKYEESGRAPIEAFKYSAYKEFFENGVRKNYEDGYFLKRTRLNACAILSLIYPEEEKYLIELSDVIWAICDEYTWALPAHMSGNEEIDDNLIDLFAAETGFTLAEIKYLLSDRLDTITKKRISKEINHRIFMPFSTRDFWWYTSLNNWSAVCATGVAACYMYEKPDEFYELKPRFDSIFDCFLKGFKEDGVCREGLVYWDYGFGMFVCYADMLKRFSNGKFDYFQQEKVKKIAEFAQNMFLEENVTVSFSDGNMSAKSRVGLMHMLRSIYGEQFKFSSKACTIVADRRWSSQLRAFLYYDKKHTEESVKECKEVYYQSSDWFVKKGLKYSFAAKGGSNSEPHNHNDIGSFIFAARGHQILCDLGAGVYTAEYFSPDACEKIFCRHSFSHSVPIINNKGQKKGEGYKGKMIVEDSRILIELKNAYEKGEAETLTRSFSFEEDKVILQDHIIVNGEYKERFVTLFKPEITEDAVVLNESCLLKYDNQAFSAKISVQKHANYLGEINVYLIDFVPSKKEISKFKMEIVVL